jgi:hypothetical protein
VLETVISATSSLEGSPPYQCIGLGAYSAPSATISRDTLEAGTTGCADLLLPQGSPGAPAQDPNTLEGAGWEISVNLGRTTNPLFNNSALCPDGGTTCKRPFVYVSPFTTAATTFGTYDFATCGTLLQTRAACPVTPHVARAVDSLRVSYNNFNFPTYDACVADLRVACTDGAPLEVLGPTTHSSRQHGSAADAVLAEGLPGWLQWDVSPEAVRRRDRRQRRRVVVQLDRQRVSRDQARGWPGCVRVSAAAAEVCARVQCVGMFCAAACAAAAACMI